MADTSMQVIRRNSLYCPNRILGSMGVSLVQSRTVLARVLGLDPASVSNVDVIGGATPETMLPVITGVQPCVSSLLDGVTELVDRLRKMTDELTRIRLGGPPWLTTGYYHSVFVRSVIDGMCGVEGAARVTSALVRSSALPGVAYLSTPVEVGPGGVTKNLGVPLLSEPEIGLLEEAVPLIEEDVRRGVAFAESLTPQTALLDPCLDPHVVAALASRQSEGIPCPELETCKLQ